MQTRESYTLCPKNLGVSSLILQTIALTISRMGKRNVVIGLVQMSMKDSAEENLKKASAMTEEAARKGAQIVVLPELFTGPYFCIVPKDTTAFARAESVPGPSTKALGKLAAQLKIVLIGGSVYEIAADGKRYNTACVFGPDGATIGTYRKTHIPHDPGFYEQDYFGSGNQPVAVHDTPFGKIAVGICYDQWFPEFARIATLKGAELIVYPTAIGNAAVEPVDPAIPEDWETKWRSAQVGHAVSNDVYVAAVNRVGDESGTHFFGGSFIADPNGRLLAKADDTEQVVTADIDLSYPKKMQQSWRFLLERRPDLYGDLTKPV